MLREVTTAARTVAGADDGDARVYAAATLQNLLEARRLISDALLTEDLSHSDACPRILSACATRDEFFDRFRDGLAHFRGADLVHVGVSRALFDRPLVNKLRRWAESTPWPIPRMVLFDSPWAAPLEANPTQGSTIVARLMDWLSRNADPLPRQAAVNRIWRELLAAPARAAAWSTTVWELWPEDALEERDFIFEQVEALRRGKPSAARPRSPIERMVVAMTSFGLCGHSRPVPMPTVAELAELAAGPFPRMLDGQHAFALGAMAARGDLSSSDAGVVLGRYLAVPDIDALDRGASITEPRITGFLAGLTAGLEQAAAHVEPVAAHLDMMPAALQRMHKAISTTTADPFGRIRGALLAALVAFDHPQLLLEQLARPADADPYELKLGCQALARRLLREGCTPLDEAVDAAFAVLGEHEFPWSFGVLEALCDALPADSRWAAVQRRVAIAREAAQVPGVLLSPAAVRAILSGDSDDQIRAIVVHSGPVSSHALLAIRPSRRASFERGEAYLRQIEEAPLAVRIQGTAAWLGEAVAAGTAVTAREIADLIATVRRLHVAAFLSPDAALHDQVHRIALRAVEAPLDAWQHLVRPFPSGQYVGTCYLALIAEVVLLSPLDVEVVAATRGLCKRCMSIAWSELCGEESRVPREAITLMRRALLASSLLDVDLPEPAWFGELESVEASMVSMLIAIEHLVSDEASFADVILASLDRLNGLATPPDARAPYVVRLMLHNLKRRLELGWQDRRAALTLVRRLRALVGGPTERVASIRSVVEDAIDLASARLPTVVVEIDDRGAPMPHVVCLLVVEEMIANAVEHGAHGGRVAVESPKHGVLAVTSEPRPGISATDAVREILDARSRGISGTRFAAQVAERWGMELIASAHEGRVRVALDVRRGGLR